MRLEPILGHLTFKVFEKEFIPSIFDVSWLLMIATTSHGRFMKAPRQARLELVSCVVVGILSMSLPLEGETFGDFTYTASETEVSIVDYPEDATGVVDIPARIDSKPVTNIGVDAFSGCRDLTGLTIPDSVSSIGDYAFAFCGLRSVTIPDSVTSIGDYAFLQCRGLTNITLPKSVTTIGEGMFMDCTILGNVTIPDGVVSIGDCAFAYCRSFTEMAIPDGVGKIGESAFTDCHRLAIVTIPDSVTSIGAGAFSGCRNLTSLTIPSKVTRIEDETFFGCINLRNLTIPDGLTGIGERACSLCVKLTSVIIPEGVTGIGAGAFSGSGLIYAYFLGYAPTLGDDVFKDSSSSFTVYYSDSGLGFTSPRWNEYTSRNLMAYAFDLNPDKKIACQLPGLENEDGTLTIRFFGVAKGIEYAFEVSDDLEVWTERSDLLTEADADGYRTASILKTPEIQFFRLTVSPGKQ
ncbi:MAG: leucine-rich repeat protein [Verrucomicrobiales bacterium]